MNIPLGEWSGSDATRELHASIRAFNEASDRQAKRMLGMTVAILLLTLVMAIGLGVQIWLAWPNK